MLLFKDGSAGLLTGANPDQNVVFIANPSAPAGSASRAVDELRLSQVWTGDAVLLRAARSVVYYRRAVQSALAWSDWCCRNANRCATSASRRLPSAC